MIFEKGLPFNLRAALRNKRVAAKGRIAANLVSFRSDARGFSMAEVVVATGLLALAAVSVVSSLSGVSKGNAVINEQTKAASMASQQMETVRASAYINYGDLYHADYTVVSAPATYSLSLIVTPIDPTTGNALGPNLDNGVQKVTVTVSHQTKQLLTVDSYKVNR